MATYLPPIERPQGLVKKMVFFLTRRQVGKVISPLTVFSARMPTGFMTFYGRPGRPGRPGQLAARLAW